MPRLVAPVVPPGSLSSTEQPTLPTSSEVLLRPWHRADAPAVAAAFSDPGIQLWHMRSIDSLDEARAWIDSWAERWHDETNASWAIIDAEGDICGQVSLRALNLAMGVSQLSYWVVPAKRRRRIATRAVAALRDWSFLNLGLHRLWLMHSAHNDASCRVATASGFSPEGILREALLHPDGWHDMHVHGQLAPSS